MLRALGRSLRTAARSVLPQFACYEDVHRCPADSVELAHPLVRVFAQAAAAEIVTRRGPLPPCPWTWEEPAAPRGYRLRIARMQIARDTARVVVFHHCLNPPGGVHRGLDRDDEYELVRDTTGAWHVRGVRMLRITTRPLRLDPPTPGAELAVALLGAMFRGSDGL